MSMLFFFLGLSVAIRGERGSYNGTLQAGEVTLECSNPG